jgi:hypothetical protein
MLPDQRDLYADVADWEWESERGARWQWYYQSSIGSRALSDVLTNAAFPDGADGELLIPMAQVVRRWNDNFVSRVSGWFVPPASVEYSFFVRADDERAHPVRIRPYIARPLDDLKSDARRSSSLSADGALLPRRQLDSGPAAYATGQHLHAAAAVAARPADTADRDAGGRTVLV